MAKGTKQVQKGPEQKIKDYFGENAADFLLSPEDFNAWNEKVKEFASKELKQVSPSQLRNIFSAVKNTRDPKEIQALRYKLAYTAGRASGRQQKDELICLYMLMDKLIRSIGEDKEKLNNFKMTFEAIIAYHRYYSG